MMRKVMVLVGTRPECIKMAPVVQALAEAEDLRPLLVCTGQHRQMARQILAFYGLTPDFDWDVMLPDQTLHQLGSRILEKAGHFLATSKPDMLLVQGDTSSAFLGALAAFYARIPVGHVEAGLRTYDMNHPFPEEGNRCLISRIARLHFAPTERPAEALRKEGIDPATIVVTGNTGIDALEQTLATAPALPEAVAERLPEGAPLVLLTAHRRENHGAPLGRVLAAVSEILAARPEARLLCPVHPNPNVRDVIHEHLGRHERAILTEPLGYPELVAAMARARLILTDSGGIQEEAPSLGVPVLVLREATERPEAIACGCARLIGTDQQAILHASLEALDAGASGGQNEPKRNPYGDGHASRRILDAIRGYFATT